MYRSIKTLFKLEPVATVVEIRHSCSWRAGGPSPDAGFGVAARTPVAGVDQLKLVN